MIDITEEEAEQYDRQIRLWGLESQKRLRGSSVLVIGMKGLGAEVCKNIILAGIKSITMMDHKKLTSNDLHSTFLTPHTMIKQNRAKASLDRAQILNPMVEVKVDVENPLRKPDEFFLSFNAIVATDCNLKLLLRLDELCHKHSIKFFSADVYGCYGYMFTNLQKHDFAEEKIIKKDKKQEKIIVKAKIQFSSLKQALEVDWTNEKYNKMLKSLDSTYPLIRVLMEFRMKARRNPIPKYVDEDMKLLKKYRNRIQKKLKLPTTVQVKDEELSMVFSQLSPVCAIVGGVLGQEIIKALSQYGEPHNNFFIYNANTLSGRVLLLN